MTARLLETLVLLADGLTNRQMASRLSLSEDAVKSRVRELMAELGARSRTHAVALGFRRGLLRVDP